MPGRGRGFIIGRWASLLFKRMAPSSCSRMSLNLEFDNSVDVDEHDIGLLTILLLVTSVGVCGGERVCTSEPTSTAADAKGACSSDF